MMAYSCNHSIQEAEMGRLREFKTSLGYSVGRGESRKENSNPHSSNKTDTNKYNKKDCHVIIFSS